MTPTDSTYMKRALTLAKKGLGKTHPNPAVGCVIVKNGTIIGEGWHKKAGGPHAEVHALVMAGNEARGADVYVTLEPCSHTGKTPPCSEALIRAGVKRVVAGMSDPNPQVNGSGLQALRRAGIKTQCGVREEECRAINRPFLKFITTGQPYVTFKCAMTLDGKIASVTGESRWISGEAARTIVHRMRSRSQAIMVGVGTVIADNPQLTVRHISGCDPLRVIVDSHLRTPEHAAVVNGHLAPGTIIATTETDEAAHARYLKNGARVVVCSPDNGQVNLRELWNTLGSLGVHSLLLEGGSHLAGAALRQGLVDECVFFYAPKVLGSDGCSPFAITGTADMAGAIPFRDLTVRRVGADIMVTAYPGAYMFTGLIEDTGRVASFNRQGEAGVLAVETALPTADIAIGDSIAVNGACLTVIARSDRSLTFDVSPESMSRTTIGALGSGRHVNLERALRLGDRLGGHIVSGHVDCAGQLTRSELRSGNHQLQFTLPPEHARYLVDKGSVTIDGISLTVNTVSRDGFSVNIIPHTFAKTTLGQLRVGDRVNIETDIIGKYVERLTSPWKSDGGLSMKTLAENGFI